MPDSAFKNNINAALVNRLADETRKVYQSFKVAQFRENTLSVLGPLELKQRIDHVTRSWAEHFPADYSEALSIVKAETGLAQTPRPGRAGLVREFEAQIEYDKNGQTNRCQAQITE